MKRPDQRAILARGRRKRFELGIMKKAEASKQKEGKPFVTAEISEKALSDHKTENQKEGKKKRAAKKEEANK